jgi:DNA-binding response OmpR family regulator
MAAILLADDDAYLRTSIERVLSANGHVVTTASDGKEALKLLATAEFDLLITDIVMPEMEGLQLLREIRGSKTPVKIIAMSGGARSSSDYLTMAAMFGAKLTLAKPFDQARLMAAVDQVLGSTDP